MCLGTHLGKCALEALISLRIREENPYDHHWCSVDLLFIKHLWVLILSWESPSLPMDGRTNVAIVPMVQVTEGREGPGLESPESCI